ncbi:hypothetical protein FOL47_001075, partial [Perkinsus chesapeaki]
MALPEGIFVSLAETLFDKNVIADELVSGFEVPDKALSLEELETLVKKGLEETKSVENFMLLVPYVLPALLSKLSAKGIAVEASEKAKRDCRVRKLNAGRKLLAGNYSIF